MTPSDDELFAPTIERLHVPTEPPYRTASLIYPAFFGGPLAMLPFALRNATRLGLSPAERRQVVLAVAGCLLAGLVGTALLTGPDGESSAPRLALQVSGLVAFGLVSRVMRGPERRLDARDVHFGGFGFWQGLASVVVLGTAQAVLLAVVLVLA